MTVSPVVWILCSNRWNSAITEYALSTARALKLRGWTVFYSGLLDSPGERRARAYDLAGDSFASFGMGDLGKLLRLRKRIKPDAVFLFGGPETFLARFMPGVPRIRFRGQDKDVIDPLSPFKNRMNMQHCQAVLVPAKILQQRFQNFLQQRVYQVTLGVDASKFHFHPEAFAEKRRPTLRIVGRLDPIKGHQQFLGIFRQLLRQWPGDRPRPFLEILGQGANISPDQLRRIAGHLQLQEGPDWVLRNERLAEISALMSGTDLAVISSLGSEVICRVAEEFSLCGAPLFVSGVGSLEECLPDKTFGSSYRQLSEARTVELLSDKLWLAAQEREALREQRAARAFQLYSLEAMGERLNLMLADLLRWDPVD